MSYIRELICVLTEQEIAELLQQKFTGNELLVLKYLCEHRSNPNADEELVKSRGFSRSYFDKITSVLYGKCLDFVATNEPYLQLNFLGRRHLHTHIYHELKIHKRAIDSGKLQIDKEQYYLIAFKSLRQMGYEYYKPEKVLEYGQYYLQEKKDRVPGDDLWIELMHLSVYLQYMRSLGKEKEYEPILLKRLAEIEIQINKDPYPRAVYYYHNTVSWYNVHYTQEYEAIVMHLKKMLKVYDDNSSHFNEFERVFVIRALAEANYDASDYNESYKLYHELWGKYYNWVNTNYYHLAHYHDVAMITGRQEESTALLKEIFQQTLKFEVVQSPKMTSMFQHIKYYLLKGDVTLALEYLNEGISHNNKNIMILDEIALRLLQVSCFVLMKDYAMALQLITRHKKFLKLKNLSPADGHLFRFLDIATGIIRYKQKKVQPSQDIIDAIQALHRGKLKIYGIIADKMMGD